MRKKNWRPIVITFIVAVIAIIVSALVSFLLLPAIWPAGAKWTGLIFFGLFAVLAMLLVVLAVKKFKISFR